jgi:predicted nuclease with TOPRIM domain
VARTVKIGDVEYRVRRQDLALLRDLEPLEDRYQDLRVEVDGLDARLASVQQKLVDLAADGEATEEAVAPFLQEQKDLNRARTRVGFDQLQTRLDLLAAKLEDATAEVLAEVIDLGAGELDRLEEEVANPPVTASEGATS